MMHDRDDVLGLMCKGYTVLAVVLSLPAIVTDLFRLLGIHL